MSRDLIERATSEGEGIERPGIGGRAGRTAKSREAHTDLQEDLTQASEL